MKINNGDRPAMPLHNADLGLGGSDLGMTKREMMAMHIISGLVSDPNVNGTQEDIAEAAVKLTDALLRKLGEKNDTARLLRTMQ
ncbi:MAG: hypothetical protein ACRCYD_01905 [Plesiomonas sp.]